MPGTVRASWVMIPPAPPVTSSEARVLRWRVREEHDRLGRRSHVTRSHSADSAQRAADDAHYQEAGSGIVAWLSAVGFRPPTRSTLSGG